MQDFQPIPGLPGLMFPDSTPNPTRRFHGHHPSSSSSSSPPIKCPRCDSTNTKFCYYNNYNLSQPRHFCKSCRRYWTKGGVLRNVPVGGGCRKNSSSKRSKPKPDKNSNPPTTAAPASASGSSSESSSNPIPNPSQDPIIQHPVFSQPDFGFGFSEDPGSGLLTEEQKVEEMGGRLGWDAAGGADSGTLFDMTSSLDPAVYWNESHWDDTDPSLYLP